MRDGVVLFGNSDVGVGAVVELARHHEGGNAGDVGLEGDYLEVEHQADVVFVSLGDIDGRVGNGELLVGVALLDLGYAALDFAQVVEVIGDAALVLRAQILLQIFGGAGDVVEEAAVILQAFEAFRGGTAVAEHALKYYLGIDFSGERRGGGAPRHGVEIGAATGGVADADHIRHVFDAEFERRDGRVLTDLAGDHLIDGRARLHVFALRVFGHGGA